MAVSVAGRSAVVSAEQLANADEAISVMPFPSTALVSAVQPKNARLPSAVTLSGICNSVSAAHSEKA